MLIIPAILTDESDAARAELDALRHAAPWVQIDVMDGTMTPGRTGDLFDLVGATDDFAVEVHLMVADPAAHFTACAAVGAQRVYVHPEPLASVHDVFAAMGEFDFARGLAVSPRTALAQIEPYLDEVDAVQVMTVEPGEQGQRFLPAMLEKVRALKQARPSLWVAVDGGVNAATLGAVVSAGADAAGVGSAIAGAPDPRAAYEALRAQAHNETV